MSDTFVFRRMGKKAREKAGAAPPWSGVSKKAAEFTDWATDEESRIMDGIERAEIAALPAFARVFLILTESFDGEGFA